MSALSIQPTYPIFTDIDGQPLEDGYVWIGTANLDPQTNPINVYWDAALTLPAAQPIRTLAGYPSNSGTPARLYVNSDYSIRVMHKNGSAVYSAPDATERYSGVVINGVNAEDVIYDPPFTSAVQTNVEAKLSQTVSVKDFGAVGDGVTDDTAAIQAAINYAVSINGGVYVPRGSYKITATLSYSFLTSGSTFTIESERSHNQGARLMWYGAAGGTIMQFRGLNGGEITGLSFQGRGIALRCLDLLENNSTGGSGSYSVNINNCFFTGTTGANNAGVRVGDNNFQTSEVHFDHCIFGGSYYGIDFATVVTAGNAKNWSVSRCYFYSCTYGISRGDSGFLLVSATYFGSMSEACVYGLSKQGGTTFISCGAEGSKRLFDTQQSSNTNPVNIIGCYFVGNTSDDIVVRAGMLFLSGNYFENSAGSGIPVISFPNGGLTSDAGTNRQYSIISQNNFYRNVSTEYAPFYSPDGDYVWNGISGNISGKAVTVKSFGDIGGTAGSLTQLRAMDGRSPIMMELSPLMNQFAAAGYSYVGPKPNRAVTKVTISNSVWTDAATAARRRVFQVPPKNKLVGIICDTTQAYAGLAGTITLRVGSPAGGTYSQDMIVDHDVKTAAVTKGLADADLGTLINRANAVQGGTMSWTANTDVYVSLISGTGNLGDGSVTNLSAGSTTIYIVTEVLEFQ